MAQGPKHREYRTPANPNW
ncbi:hypothetical protein DERP_005145 [Dermatophagoides pteronyssinus]|uniref:Uncharacterized protein n=1 Tax=Dermatophagoides pteronyssinus TaxID=6956 RepID=A0ABQ8JMI3_DERPT|nr:hypothetical protein DERP_005145 [Dermatophagoides pteronyssinus]